ncbi:MAG: malate dehydrogenase [bacterium]
MPKIGFIGAGHVGATAANYAARQELGDVVLVDIQEGMPQGKALDMSESRPVSGFDPSITGTNDYDASIEGCDLFVVTAGLPRKPGMTREDLLKKNASIIEDIGTEIRDKAPNSKIIMVTNPLDVMTYLMREVTGFPSERVIGQAGVLDSARFSYFIADELDVSTEDVDAMVLGGHGDSMVPLPRYTTVSGISVQDLIDDQRIEEMVERTRGAGGEIVDLLGDGSAFYAPADAVIQMSESILKDKKRILPCSVYADGQYGLDDVYIGLPAKLGANGVEDIIELDLTDEEYDALEESADFYAEQIDIALGAVSV